MTERDLEGRLRELYRLDAARTAPASLRLRVIALPDSTSRRPLDGPVARRGALLLAAALVLGGMAAGAVLVGSGRVEVPAVAEVSSPAPSSPAPSPRPSDAMTGDPAGVEPCSLFSRAVVRAGLEAGRFNGDHGRMFWDAKVCINDGWDGSWENRHFLFRTRSTSLDDAVGLLGSVRLGLAASGTHEFGGWATGGTGVWIGRWSLKEDAPTAGFIAVVVSEEPYFFAVTGHAPAETHAVAEAVLVELREAAP